MKIIIFSQLKENSNKKIKSLHTHFLYTTPIKARNQSHAANKK